MAVGNLHRGQAPERALHALTTLLGVQTVDAQHLRRGVVQFQRRIALAGRLFRAPVWVFQRTLQGTGERDRRQRADRHARGYRPRHQPVGEARAHLHRRQAVQHLRARAQHRRPARAYRHVVAAVDLEAVALHAHAHLRRGVALVRRDRECQRALGVHRQVGGPAAFADVERTLTVHRYLEHAGLAGEVLHVQRHRAPVARREHARQAGLGHDRRAHHGLAIAIAVTRVRVHQRRDAQRAVEVRHLQRDARIALAVQLHRPGEQVHGLNARGRPLRLRQGRQCHVAAEADLRAAAFETLDHAPVDVVGIDPKPALREELRVRIRDREAGDVEDAHVHRGHGDVRQLSRKLGHADGDRQVLLRSHLLRYRQPDGDTTVATIHRHMHHADGACRRDLAGRRTATEHQRGDVDIVPFPVLGHRNGERAARLGIDRLHVQHAVALDHQQTLARMRRRDRHLQRVAGLVAGPVQRQLDLVGARIQSAVLVVPAPAGAERVARGQASGRIEHVQPVFAPFHREVDLRCTRAHVQRARVLVLETAGEVVIPATVLVVVPVVVAQLAHQRGLQPLARLRLATRIDAHHFEAGVGIRIGAVLVVEQRADTDQRIRRPQHALQRAVHRAAAGLVDAAGHDGGDGTARLGLGGQRDVFLQHAVLGQCGVDDVLRVLRQLHRRVAEEVSGQLVQRMLLDRDGEFGGEAVAAGGCAVQVGRGGLELQRLARFQHGLRRVQVQLHALGQELLDAQRHALHRLLAGRVGAELHLPAPGRRFRRDRLLEAEIALRTGLQARLAEHLAVRLLQAQEHRLAAALLRRRYRPAVVVAQQRGDAHRFARAVQVAPGPCEHVEPRLLATGHGELGQVERRLVERQHGHILAARGDQHMTGIQGVVQQRVAIAVGLAGQDGFAPCIQHFQFHAAGGRAVLQRRGVDEQLVLVGARVQANVADGEEGGLELAGELAGALHHREVQTRILQFADVLDRQIGQYALVGLAAQHEAVEVDGFGQLAQRRAVAVLAVQVPAAPAAAALVLGEELRQLLLADAQEFHVHFRHIDRHHGQAPAFARRQHAALRGEAHGRIEFAGVHLAGVVLAQARAVGGGQAGLQGDFVVLCRLHRGEAQHQTLVVQHPAALHHGTVGVLHHQQRIEVLRADQGTAEFQCDGEVAVMLVGIGANQGETFHLGGLRLDRLAAGFGQLPGFVALAAGQCGRCDQANEKRAHPAGARVSGVASCRSHVPFPAVVVPAV